MNAIITAIATAPATSVRFPILRSHRAILSPSKQLITSGDIVDSRSAFGLNASETERQGGPFSLIFRLDQATITVAVSRAQNPINK
jgi:hypothetical protein